MLKEDRKIPVMLGNLNTVKHHLEKLVNGTYNPKLYDTELLLKMCINYIDQNINILEGKI